MPSLSFMAPRRHFAMPNGRVSRNSIAPKAVILRRVRQHFMVQGHSRQFSPMTIRLIRRAIVRDGPNLIQLRFVTLQGSTQPISKRSRTLRTRLNGRHSILFMVIMGVRNFVTEMMITLRSLYVGLTQSTITYAFFRINGTRTLTVHLMNAFMLINNNHATPRRLF